MSMPNTALGIPRKRATPATSSLAATKSGATNTTMAFTATAAQRKLKLSLLMLAALVVTVLTFGAASARADFSLVPNSFVADAYKADGVTPETQAGATPYQASVEFSFVTLPDPNPLYGILDPDGDVKDIDVNLPAGLVGDPQAVPRCPRTALVQPDAVPCPVATQVGVLRARLSTFGFGPNGPQPFQDIIVPVFNLVPRGDDVADFGFVMLGVTVHIIPSVRTDGDFGVRASLKNISSAFPVISSKLTLWGVPADPSHDPERGLLCGAAGCIFGPGNMPSELVPRAFLRNPTFCGPPVTTTFRADSWQNPGQFISAASTTASGPTGCDKLAFDPSITTTLDTSTASSPAGLSVDLAVPQPTDPNTLATPHLKKAVVKLPVGVTLSPSAADGLQGCSDAQIGLHSNADPTCPPASKIGDVRLETPVLPDALTGPVYLGTQTPSQLVRLFLVMRGPGLLVKLAGKVDLDPVTGQLTATFDDNPQLPFSDLKLNFKSGSRAALTTPSSCGTYTTQTSLTPWSGDDQTAHPTSSFVIDKGCGNENTFAPSFDAGVLKPRAGGNSPLTLTFDRTDRDQSFSRIDTVLPPGLLAKVGSVPLCGDAQASTGACPAESLIGKTTVGAGPGSDPFFLGGRVYLTGPYKGSNYGLSIVVPALAGPFDLGIVTVRAGIWIDPHDAQVTVKSDPLPTILQGIPLQVRTVNVNIDRPGFMVNPTNCEPSQIAAAIRSTAGAVANVSSGFQVTDCAVLGLAPKMAMRLTNGSQTTDGKHPGLDVFVTQGSGQANLKKVAVTLPLSLALDPDNSQSDSLCEYDAGRKTIPECPASSIIGRATATTPLLNEPLSGPVYFVKNVRTDAKTGRQIKTLPTLAIPLQGAGITLVLRGSSAVVDGRLVTTFDTIPDAPVSDFKLNINGGKKGILVVSGADICKATQTADQAADGQNGKTADTQIIMSTPCGLAVVASSHTPTSLKLTVGGIGAGKLSVSGAGIAKTSRTIAGATTATLQPRLSKATRSTLAHGHNVKTKVTVSFTPKGATKTKTAHKTLIIHGVKKP